MFNWFSNLPAVQWIVGFLIILFLLAIINRLLKRHGKKIRFLDIIHSPFGDFKIEEADQDVDSLAILTQPMSSDQMPLKLPHIKVKVYNRANHPLKGKKVTVTLTESATFKKRNELRGTLIRITGRDGCVVFNDLVVDKRGAFYLDFEADGISKNTKTFQVTSPGVDTDYMGKRYGTEEYYEALKTAVSLTRKGSDRVIVNDEEV